MIGESEISITEEDWDRIRKSLPVILNSDDILMIILSILVQYVEEKDESVNILMDCLDNVDNAYQCNVDIKSRMH